MNYAGILKRGYLFDKKVGILPVTVDRKRWYVLKQDATQGNQVILEFYKDEKAAYKGDRPKGFINIHDVVSVRRVVDKKQSFEILCPGVGYRLMANSDLEADEWTQAIRNHISYMRDDGGSTISGGMKTMSLNRIQNGSPGHIQLTSTHHIQPQPHPHPHHHQERQRALSESHHHSTHLQQAQPPFQHHQHHHHHLQPRSIPIVPPLPRRSSTDTHTTVQLNRGVSTPPEGLSSPPSLPPFLVPPPAFQRQRSVDTNVSLHSNSSDSSSMCSGSNTSFEGGGGAVFEADGMESKSLFQVQIKETESLNVSGAVDLAVSEDGLRLQSISPDQKELVYWPLGCLRRYGVNNHCFTIITGRYCATGEGRFQFYTDESRMIHAKLHGYATQKAGISGRSRSTPRRDSEPIEFGGRSPQQTTPIHSINPTQSLPPHLYSTSPPIMYSHSPVRGGGGGGVQYTHSITQPITVGSHNVVPNQHFSSHFSPTKSMHYPPQLHVLPNQSQNSFQYPPNTQFYVGSPPDSIPILPPRSREFQNQSLPLNKSISSSGSSSGGDSGCPVSLGSSVGSGGETGSSSEVPSPVSDQDVTLSDIVATSTVHVD